MERSPRTSDVGTSLKVMFCLHVEILLGDSSTSPWFAVDRYCVVHPLYKRRVGVGCFHACVCFEPSPSLLFATHVLSLFIASFVACSVLEFGNL